MEEMEETRSFESEDSMDCDSFTPPIIGNKLPWQKNRIIDFENAARSVRGWQSTEGPDAGCLLGLENIQEILESLVDYEPKASEP